MSRTTETSNKKKSPIKFWLSFKADSGKVVYTQKNEDGEYQDVLLDELEFVLMDSRASIAGWDDESSSRIFSNLVRYTKDESFQVRSKKGVLVEGVYSDIKDKVVALGGKFCTNLFVLAKINGVFEPCVFQVSKTSQAAWSKFTEGKKLYDLYNVLVKVTKGEEGKKGKIKFVYPAFESTNVDPTLSDMADDFDKNELQPYLMGETAEKEKDKTEKEENLF